MANSTISHNDMLSVLPRELRDIIWKHVFEDSRLWVGCYGSRRRDSTVIRRFVSDNEPTSGHHPHPLARVSRLIARDIRQLWQRHPLGRLHLDSRLDYFPPQIFNGITHLSLTMAQGARALQFTVPLIDYHNSNPPATHLVPVHAPAIEHLDIHWEMDFFSFENTVQTNLKVLGSTIPEDFLITLIRLLFFRRSFEITIHFRATSNQEVLVTGSIENGDFHPLVINNLQYHGRMVDNPLSQGIFVQEFSTFNWTLMLPFTVSLLL